MVSCALSSCISVDKILFVLLSYIVQGCPQRMDMQSSAMLRSLLKKKKKMQEQNLKICTADFLVLSLWFSGNVLQ